MYLCFEVFELCPCWIETTIEYDHEIWNHNSICIYVLKFLNCVCVELKQQLNMIMRIETIIEYGHKKLKLGQFDKKLKQQFIMRIENWNKSIQWWEKMKQQRKFWV
jgi:hypothetical protein